MEKIIQADPNKENRGKAYAVNPTGDLVLLEQSTELRMGWHWATQDDVKLASHVARILKDEPDAPVDQVRDHVARVLAADATPESVEAPSDTPSGASDQ